MTINALYYHKILRTLKRHVNKTRPDPKIIWLSHHKNAKSDLAECHFWVFGALKWELRNKYFESDAESATAVNLFFQDLPPEVFYKTMTAK